VSAVAVERKHEIDVESLSKQTVTLQQPNAQQQNNLKNVSINIFIAQNYKLNVLQNKSFGVHAKKPVTAVLRKKHQNVTIGILIFVFKCLGVQLVQLQKNVTEKIIDLHVKPLAELATMRLLKKRKRNKRNV